MDRILDHGPNPPLFGLLPSFDNRPPAPLAATHYPGAMCVAAWSDLTNKASIGLLSRGGVVTLAWSLDHGPNPPLFGLLPLSDDHATVPLTVTHYRDVMCVARLGPIRPTRQASVHFLGGWLIHFFLGHHG